MTDTRVLEPSLATGRETRIAAARGRPAGKTASTVEKCGPGPRSLSYIGPFGPGHLNTSEGASREVLRDRFSPSQEALVREAARVRSTDTDGVERRPLTTAGDAR